MRVERPWGFFELIETREFFQIKYLEVSPGKRLSLQSHRYRSEHWKILSGTGNVTINSENIEVSEGDSVTIPQGAKHRISANSDAPVCFIEIQTGSSFEEDDIVRYEDDFGRGLH